VDRLSYGLTEEPSWRNQWKNHGQGPSDVFDVRRSTEGVFSWEEAQGIRPACPQEDTRGCWDSDNTLLTVDIDHGHLAEGDSGGPALVILSAGGYALVGVAQGCATVNGEYYGYSNRVDTGSRAFEFIARNVGVIQTARP
jgi:hypothetical protein